MFSGPVPIFLPASRRPQNRPAFLTKLSSPQHHKYPHSQAESRAGPSGAHAQQDLFLAASSTSHKRPSVAASAAAHSRGPGPGQASKGPIVWLPGLSSLAPGHPEWGAEGDRGQGGLRGPYESCCQLKDVPVSTMPARERKQTPPPDRPQAGLRQALRSHRHTHTHTPKVKSVEGSHHVVGEARR